MLAENKKYIQRCLDLARLGTGRVSPNPLVGAVLVYQDRVIGEGFHQRHGGPHAEVNAINSVREEDRQYIARSTLYVSLEPCCIYGKTPPCSTLIIENKIPKVVIAALDQTPGVDGASIELLRKAGVEVTYGVLEKEGQLLSVIRNTFVRKKRPYIFLKYAQTADGFIGKYGEQVWISNKLSKRLTHKWRSEIAAILVGTNTAVIDNPQLNTRHYFGPSPLRIALDRQLKIPPNAHLLDQTVPTWIIHEQLNCPKDGTNLKYIRLQFDQTLLPSLLQLLYEAGKSSLLVEGGARLLQSFITQGLWDAAYVFISKQYLLEGIAAPSLPVAPLQRFKLGNNDLLVFYH